MIDARCLCCCVAPALRLSASYIHTSFPPATRATDPCLASINGLLITSTHAADDERSSRHALPTVAALLGERTRCRCVIDRARVVVSGRPASR